jgi:hypothetical protein
VSEIARIKLCGTQNAAQSNQALIDAVTIAPRLRTYRSFNDARAFARTLKLKNITEWRGYTKSGRLPDDIPVGANQVYKNGGWVSWGDWLGTGKRA